jgi:phosphatidylinositol 4-kinase
MGGEGGDMFEYFKILILQGLVAARKHEEKFINLVDVMRAGKYRKGGVLRHRNLSAT